MTFAIRFKTPDVIEDAICEEVLRKHQQLAGEEDDLLTEEQQEEVFFFKKKLEKLVSSFTSGMEYLTVEFDVEAGTCQVVKTK